MNILLTSVGRRSYMIRYFQHALEGRGLVHAANSVYTYSMSVADHSVLTPLIHDERYIDFLLEYCVKHHIGLVIPLFDIDLPVLSQHKHRFEAIGVTVVVSDYELVKTCNDKWLTYQFFQRNHIPTPVSYLHLEDALKGIEEEKLRFPLIVKPRWGMGSMGVFEADNAEELALFYKKVIHTIESSYLIYESRPFLSQSVIIQQKLSGVEYGLDVFNDLNGEYMTCVPKQKLSMRAGETDSALLIEHKGLSELGKRLSHVCGHIGNLDVDCFEIEEVLYVLELNCRFGGQYPFSHLGGVDFPKFLVDQRGGKTINKALVTYTPGITTTKEMIPVVVTESK